MQTSRSSTRQRMRHFAAFGDFGFSVTTTGGQGAGGSQPSPVTFTFTAAGLTESSFIANAGGTVFGVDVYNPTNGNTGPIGTGTVSTPEPISLITLGIGVLGLGFTKRKIFS